MPPGRGEGGRLRVGVVFGGPSREHGVSFLSGRCLLSNLPADRYEPLPVFVGKDGLWHGPSASAAEMDRQLGRPPRDLLLDGIRPSDPAAPADEVVASFRSAFEEGRPDVLFPIAHGTFGEDGAWQGLFESLSIPYVGCGVTASAVGMDKAVMKAVLGAAGLPQVDYFAFSRSDWGRPRRRDLLFERVEELGFPVFVKPACAGSSVGVSKVKSFADLGPAVEAALELDERGIVEEGVDAREIECSVLEGEDGGPTEASLPGEIVPGHEFYDYEDKYIDDRSRSVIPAELPASTREEVRRLAVAAFDALGGAGFARVDFFLERGTGRVLLNELNSLPGFTPISMFPKMWEATGLALPDLLDRLVRSAFQRPRRGR
ncbi:D-alanine--D-alanine ligase [Acidobacteria bacterium ACD]|nr:D-alanine--D-alanine ligase [Acidobacteria bacterium ACD]